MLPVYQDVSAERPDLGAGVTIPVDFWSPQFGLSGYCHLYISERFSAGLSNSSCPQLENQISSDEHESLLRIANKKHSKLTVFPIFSDIRSYL